MNATSTQYEAIARHHERMAKALRQFGKIKDAEQAEAAAAAARKRATSSLNHGGVTAA